MKQKISAWPTGKCNNQARGLCGAGRGRGAGTSNVDKVWVQNRQQQTHFLMWPLDGDVCLVFISLATRPGLECVGLGVWDTLSKLRSWTQEVKDSVLSLHSPGWTRTGEALLDLGSRE